LARRSAGHVYVKPKTNSVRFFNRRKAFSSAELHNQTRFETGVQRFALKEGRGYKVCGRRSTFLIERGLRPAI
jgi:hypothetical protein